MKKRTTLSEDILMVAGNAKYDAAVKNLLADRQILAWILKSCAEEFKGMSVREIADKCIVSEPQVSETAGVSDETEKALKITGTGIEDVTVMGEPVIFDIRFEAVIPKNGETVGLIINVEAQSDFYPGYPLTKRGIYYCGRMISSQYGTVFTQSHYEKLKKVYSIWICTNPPKGRENTITGYSIKEWNYVGNVKELPRNYDLLTMVMVCLGRPDGEGSEGILKLLNVLLSSDIKPDDKCDILERDFDIPKAERMEGEVSRMCNLSEGVMRKGIEKGLSLVNELYKRLIAEGRSDDWQHSIEDEAYQRKLLEEYGLLKQ